MNLSFFELLTDFFAVVGVLFSLFFAWCLLKAYSEAEEQRQAEMLAFETLQNEKEEQRLLIEKATREGAYFILPVTSGYAVYDGSVRSGEKLPPYYCENLPLAEFVQSQCNASRSKVGGEYISMIPVTKPN